MKSISIHGLDDQLNQKIIEQARRKGLSLNKTIKALLEEALGLSADSARDHRDDFIEFLGVWRDEDVREFELATKDFQQIDPEDWK